MNRIGNLVFDDSWGDLACFQDMPPIDLERVSGCRLVRLIKFEDEITGMRWAIAVGMCDEYLRVKHLYREQNPCDCTLEARMVVC